MGVLHGSHYYRDDSNIFPSFPELSETLNLL